MARESYKGTFQLKFSFWSSASSSTSTAAAATAALRRSPSAATSQWRVGAPLAPRASLPLFLSNALFLSNYAKFLYRALAQDQLRTLLEMKKGLDIDIQISIYDGDNSKEDRIWTRSNAQILITNPDNVTCVNLALSWSISADLIQSKVHCD